MTLPDFIKDNLDALLDDWDAFAKSIDLSDRNLTLSELRNDARKILKAIADDIAKAQTDREQEAKSKGDRPHHAPVITKYARSHAMDRLSHGFDLDEMVSEYRALRASVIRQWTAKLKHTDRTTLDELIRFNEAVDQGTTESIRQYSLGLERARGISLGVLAHDLRTPLSAISSSAEAILRKKHLSADEVTKTAQWIRNSSVRMQRIVDDLVDFTRTASAPSFLSTAGTPTWAKRAGRSCRSSVTVTPIAASGWIAPATSPATGTLSVSSNWCRICCPMHCDTDHRARS